LVWRIVEGEGGGIMGIIGPKMMWYPSYAFWGEGGRGSPFIDIKKSFIRVYLRFEKR
jgi:hypothetical protein